MENFPRYWTFVWEPTRRPVTRSFDVFFDLRLNKRLCKQSWGWLFQTPSHQLWRHCNEASKPCSILWGESTSDRAFTPKRANDKEIVSIPWHVLVWWHCANLCWLYDICTNHSEIDMAVVEGLMPISSHHATNDSRHKAHFTNIIINLFWKLPFWISWQFSCRGMCGKIVAKLWPDPIFIFHLRICFHVYVISIINLCEMALKRGARGHLHYIWNENMNAWLHLGN